VAGNPDVTMPTNQQKNGLSWVVSGAAIVVGGYAPADIVYLTQNRFVQGTAGPAGNPTLVTDFENAPDFGSFIANSGALHTEQPSGLRAIGTASSLHSSLTPTSLLTDGQATSRIENQSLAAGGMFSFDVTFRVTQATEYIAGVLMQRDILINHGAQGAGFVTLTGSSGIIFDVQYASETERRIDLTGQRVLRGTLNPGDYRFQVFAEISGGSAITSTSYVSTNLTIPVPSTASVLLCGALCAMRRRRRPVACARTETRYRSPIEIGEFVEQ
jgi:hypothetical protein